MHTSGTFPSFSQGGGWAGGGGGWGRNSFCYFLLDFLLAKLLLKKGCSTRNEFALRGANSFLLDLSPFQKGSKRALTELPPKN